MHMPLILDYFNKGKAPLVFYATIIIPAPSEVFPIMAKVLDCQKKVIL